MAHKVFISPSDQTGNKYAAGDTNEAVQCNIVGAHLRTALERCGMEVKLMSYCTMQERAAAADAWGAELYLPIHSNASVAHNATGTRVFYWPTSTNGKKAAAAVYGFLAPVTPGTGDALKTATLYECRVPKAPTAYVEIDFHDVAEVAGWIIANTKLIAETICRGVCAYFNVPYVGEGDGPAPHGLPVLRKGSLGDAVRAVQILLIGYGHSCGPSGADGDFGSGTEAGLKAFQAARQLDADGICGIASWAALLGV